MNTKAQQLRLAADIIKTGCPWEFKDCEKWHSNSEHPYMNPIQCLFNEQEIRIKQFILPSPPQGKEWHRTDGWTEDMLPEGYRPLLEGEVMAKETDSFRETGDKDFTTVSGLDGMLPSSPERSFYRTTRPLPTEPEYIDLGPEDVPPGSVFRSEGDCGWIAPTHVLSNGIKHQDTGCGVTFTYYSSLNQACHKINRSIPLTGKWDATAWEPCRKQK